MSSRQGQVVWLTGLSGAGKTTLCRTVEAELRRLDLRVHVIDGDDFRKQLCADLGFSDSDRAENIRRITYVAGLLAENGVTVLVAAIAPLRSMREHARSYLSRFVEVYVDSPLAICESRDPKGLYKRARAGEIPEFTGVASPYEPPLSADVVCHTDREEIRESTQKILTCLLPKYERRANAALKADGTRLTIAVDFDDVIANYSGWKGRTALGRPREDVAEALRALAGEGWKIIIHTTRCGEDTLEYLQHASIPFDEINTNTDYQNQGASPLRPSTGMIEHFNTLEMPPGICPLSGSSEPGVGEPEKPAIFPREIQLRHAPLWLLGPSVLVHHRRSRHNGLPPRPLYRRKLPDGLISRYRISVELVLQQRLQILRSTTWTLKSG